jgi:peptidoglycan hydrolase CwlO-like protein
MPEGSALYLIQQTLKNLAPEAVKSVTSLKNLADQMLVIKAISLGLDISQAQIDQLNYQGGMSQNADKMRKQIEQDILSRVKVTAEAAKILQDAFKNTGDGTGEKSAFQLAIEQLQNQRKEMAATAKAYSTLRAAGISAGKAFAIAKDPILAAAIATTKVGTKKWKELIKLIKETDQGLIKSKLTELRADTEYTKQFTAIVPVLKTLGLNSEEIQNIFSDPSFAQEFINGIKNGKMTVSDLNKLINQTMQNRTAKLTFETSLKTDDEIFDEAMSKANEMFDKVQAGIEAQYRGQISAGEAAVTKAQDNISKVQEDIDKIQVGIDTKQRDVEISITREIEKFQNQIDTLQNTIKEKFDIPLQTLSDEGDILSNTLSLIDRQTSKINEKYDAQAAALTKISEVNSEIANQQKQQLGLADALSRGDIAAAAAAAQEMRATAAENAQGRQSGIIESARSAALAGVTVNGMTRAQIEERQFQISQQSFVLQQQRKVLEQSIADIEAKQIAPLNVARVAAEKAIRDLEDEIYGIQQKRLIPAQAAVTKAEAELKATQDKFKADLAVIEQNKQSWIDAKTARDLALLDQENYKEALVKTDGVAKGVLDKILALNTTVRTVHQIHTVNTSSGSSAGFSTSASKGAIGPGAPQFKAYGGKIIAMNAGGMVPKYMARGGAVGSDTVPAMLTPGEFVMNRGAVKRFGPMLENMNNSKYPSMIKDLTPTTYTNVNSSMVTPIVNNVSTSVSDNSSTMYNYNVGINVNESNASSSDIARAVIGQIKYIDSQRIRGQR